MHKPQFLVCTASSEEYAPLAAITQPTKEVYAQKWGYDFHAFHHIQYNRMGWERVDFWVRALDLIGSGGWIFFTGCDAMITNKNIPLENFVQSTRYTGGIDFIIAADGNGLQSDSFLLKNNFITRKFLEDVQKQEGRANNEQDAISVALSKMPDYSSFAKSLGDLKQEGEPPPSELIYKLEVHLNRSSVDVGIMPQRSINAYPLDLYGGSLDMSHSWQPGDFVCHTPGIPLHIRLKEMPKYLAMVKTN